MLVEQLHSTQLQQNEVLTAQPTECAHFCLEFPLHHLSKQQQDVDGSPA